MLKSDNSVDGVIGSHIAIAKQSDGTYKATPKGLENLSQSGRDEFEAMSKVRAAIQKAASEGKL